MAGWQRVELMKMHEHKCWPALSLSEKLARTDIAAAITAPCTPAPPTASFLLYFTEMFTRGEKKAFHGCALKRLGWRFLSFLGLPCCSLPGLKATAACWHEITSILIHAGAALIIIRLLLLFFWFFHIPWSIFFFDNFSVFVHLCFNSYFYHWLYFFIG